MRQIQFEGGRSQSLAYVGLDDANHNVICDSKLEPI